MMVQLHKNLQPLDACPCGKTMSEMEEVGSSGNIFRCVCGRGFVRYSGNGSNKKTTTKEKEDT